jgi:hypothetical protein
MIDLDVKLQAEIVAAVKRSIEIMGIEAFKRTSFFGKSHVNPSLLTDKLAA